MAKGRSQQIFSANDLGYAHGRIIDRSGKVIRGNIILPPNDKIAKILSRDSGLLAEPKIEKSKFLTIRHTKPPVHAGRCRGRYGRSPNSWPASAGVNWLFIFIMGGDSGFQNILARAGTRID